MENPPAWQAPSSATPDAPPSFSRVSDRPIFEHSGQFAACITASSGRVSAPWTQKPSVSAAASAKHPENTTLRRSNGWTRSAAGGTAAPSDNVPNARRRTRQRAASPEERTARAVRAQPAGLRRRLARSFALESSQSVLRSRIARASLPRVRSVTVPAESARSDRAPPRSAGDSPPSVSARSRSIAESERASPADRS